MDALDRALAWLGLTESHRAALEAYADWLGTEGIAGGGLGPQEGPRVLERHVVDALLFAGVWSESGPVLDVGTGVGLPGVPLAIVSPHRQFLLVDRSGRRVELLRRAVRILRLDNVEVVQSDLEGIDWQDMVVVSRASLTPADFLARVARVGPPRELLVGGSHVSPPQVAGFETAEIPAEILDHPVWILRMAQS